MSKTKEEKTTTYNKIIKQLEVYKWLSSRSEDESVDTPDLVKQNILKKKIRYITQLLYYSGFEVR